MAIIEGTTRLKEAVGEYDFAVDGGAVSTITLRSAGGASTGAAIPSGSVIVGGYLEVDTVPTSGGGATIGVSSEAASDLVAAAAISGAPWSTTGRKSLITVSGATSVKSTAARSLAIVIGTAALTAGKFRVVVSYR